MKNLSVMVFSFLWAWKIPSNWKLKKSHNIKHQVPGKINTVFHVPSDSALDILHTARGLFFCLNSHGFVKLHRWPLWGLSWWASRSNMTDGNQAGRALPIQHFLYIICIYTHICVCVCMYIDGYICVYMHGKCWECSAAPLQLYWANGEPVSFVRD